MSRYVIPGPTLPPNASSTVKGIAKLSSNPSTPTDPVALNNEEVSATPANAKVAKADGGGTLNAWITSLSMSVISGLASALSGKVDTSRNINTASPLAGGGSLSSDLTLSVATATPTQSGVAKEIWSLAKKPSVAGTFDEEMDTATLVTSFSAYPGSGQTVAQNALCTNGGRVYVASIGGVTAGTAPTGTGTSTDGGVTWVYFANSGGAATLNGWITASPSGTVNTTTDLTATPSSGNWWVDATSRPGRWLFQGANNLTLTFQKWGTIPTNGWFYIRFRTTYFQGASGANNPSITFNLIDSTGSGRYIQFGFNKNGLNVVRANKVGTGVVGPTLPSSVATLEYLAIQKKGTNYYFYTADTIGTWSYVGTLSETQTLDAVVFEIIWGTAAVPGASFVEIDFLRSTSSLFAP